VRHLQHYTRQVYHLHARLQEGSKVFALILKEKSRVKDKERMGM
jgi:hypothetical protein